MSKPESVTTKIDEAIIILIRLTGACRMNGISKAQIEEGIQGVIKKLENIKNAT